MAHEQRHRCLCHRINYVNVWGKVCQQSINQLVDQLTITTAHGKMCRGLKWIERGFFLISQILILRRFRCSRFWDIGITTATAPRKSRKARKLNKVSRIFKSLHFEVTHKCNLRCLHCYNAEYLRNSNGDLTTEQVFSVIDLAKEFGCEHIGYSGGEPFSRRDFLDILRYTSDSPVHILTNGSLITEAILSQIQGINELIEFRVSLDGVKTHAVIRGRSHEETLKKIRMISDAGYLVTVNTTINSYNVDELEELYDILKTDKIDRWRIDFTFNYGNAKDNNIAVPSALKAFPILKKILKSYLSATPNFDLDINKFFRSTFIGDRVVPMEYDANSRPCEYQSSLTIRPNGGVSFCPSLDVVFGNILKEPLIDILNKPTWRNVEGIRARDLGEQCVECDLLRVCGGGCRADAYYDSGDLCAPYQFNCKAMQYYVDEIEPLLYEYKQLKNVSQKI